MHDTSAALAAWLAAGGEKIGQVGISRFAAGTFALSHADDTGRSDLENHTGPEAARALAQHDDAGAFRPLKTAPTLRHGWRVELRDFAELRRALDYLYPAMPGILDAWQRGALAPVPLRETLARQTGMYAVTKNITDGHAAAMTSRFCAGCLKTRLWDIATCPPAPHIDTHASFPLLCHEACNLLVAEARKVVKTGTAPTT